MVFQGTTFLHALDLHGYPGWLASGDEMLEGDPGGGAPPGRQVHRAEGSLANLLHQVEHGAERQPLEHLTSNKIISVLRIPVTFWYGSGAASLTNGFESGSCYFRQWSSRWKLKIILKKMFFCLILFKATFSKIKSHKQVTKPTYFAWW